MAVAAVELGDLDRADRFNREAIRLKAASKGNTLWNTLNAASIAAGRGKRDEAKALFTEALQASGTEPAARWEAHAGLANTLLAAGDAARATVHFEAALGTIRGVRAELLKPEYRLTFLTRVIRFYQQYVDTLVRAGSLDRALLVSDSSRAVVLAERMGSGGVVRPAPPVTADRLVTAAGRSRTIWLAYWLAPAGSHVWVVTGSGIHHAPLPPAADIDRLVQRYRTLVEGSSADPLGDPAGAALYAALIAPISRHIPPGASVRIVADGTLHGVNFETLPVDGAARRYWIEDVTVAVAPSLALLARTRQREGTGRGPVAAAGRRSDAAPA